jgi:S-phase kinase-associated protein 1
MAQPAPTINTKLVSKDNITMEINIDVAKFSLMICDLFESLGEDDDTPIPITNITAAILTKIFEFCEHYLTGDRQNIQDTEDPWNAEWLNMEQRMLFEVINSVNFLNIPDLLELMCKHIANQIKNKTPEQISAFFQ